MRLAPIFPVLALLAATGTLSAQAPVTMPAGDYVIQARDNARTDSVGMVGWPLQLKGNGSFTIITMPDSLPLAGKMVQKDGMATLTDQTCSDGIGVYFVRKVGNGYAFDLKSDSCTGRGAGWIQLLFMPGKPKK